MKKLSAWMLSLVMLTSLVSGCAKPVEETEQNQTTKNQEEVAYTEENLDIVSTRDTNIKTSLVVPTEENENGYPLVMLLHGFMGSREESGSFNEVAYGLAKQGIASVRFDFPGCNESDEDFLNYTMSNMDDDVHSVLDYVTENISIDENKIGVLGYSMGGRVAIQSLETIDVNTLVLWAPVASDGLGSIIFLGTEEELDLAIHSAVDNVSTVTAWGDTFDVSTDLLTQVRDEKPTELLNQYNGNVLFIRGSMDDIVFEPISQAGIDAATNTNITAFLEIPRTGHGLGSYDEDYGVRKVVVNATVNFFADYLK